MFAEIVVTHHYIEVSFSNEAVEISYNSSRKSTTENENDFRANDFTIVSLSREVETLSAKTAAKTENLLCFFDLFESFSSIMSPGNRYKLRQLLCLRLLYMRLQRFRSRRVLQYSDESLRFQRTFNFHRQTRGKCKHNKC